MGRRRYKSPLALRGFPITLLFSSQTVSPWFVERPSFRLLLDQASVSSSSPILSFKPSAPTFFLFVPPHQIELGSSFLPSHCIHIFASLLALKSKMVSQLRSVLLAISLLSVCDHAFARMRWLERDGRSVELYPRRFNQEHPAVIDKLASACPGQVCGTLSGQAITPLLAAQGECTQQDMADSIIGTYTPVCSVSTTHADNDQ